MKKIRFILIFSLLMSCSLFDKKYAPSPKGFFLNDVKNYLYEDFPNEDTTHINVSSEDNFEEGGIRYGKIINGYKQGKWLSGAADFDENGNVIAKGKIHKEEHFKKGLRDSIFRQFNSDGKIIYETTFKNGTGLWKEFHSNGKLYFEIATKNGYFTDTLMLHSETGEIFQKRLYNKDSLIFRQNLIIDYNTTDNKN